MVKKLKKIKIAFVLLLVLGRSWVVEGSSFIPSWKRITQVVIDTLDDKFFDKEVDKKKVGKDFATLTNQLKDLGVKFNMLLADDYKDKDGKKKTIRKGALSSILSEIDDVVGKLNAINAIDIKNCKNTLASIKNISGFVNFLMSKENCDAGCEYRDKISPELKKKIQKVGGIIENLYELVDKKNSKSIPSIFNDLMWYLKVFLILGILWISLKICQEVSPLFADNNERNFIEIR